MPNSLLHPGNVATPPWRNSRNNRVFAATTVADIPLVYQEYARVFNKVAANELPKHGPQDHAIDFASTKTPPFGPFYNFLTNKLKALWDYVSNNVASGFIQQSTLSAGAPILFVKKKDGTLRLCVDYRGLNCIITKNWYLLPLLSEALDRLSGAKIYTKIDFWDAFDLIRIKEGNCYRNSCKVSLHLNQ